MNNRIVRRESRLLLFGLLVAGVLAGCNRQDRFDVSGSVTLDGAPVSEGQIMFLADTAKGNDGPQGIASIGNGRYSTQRDGKGAPSGPTFVRVEMIDGEFMYVYETREEFPAQSSTKDYNLSRQETKKMKWKLGEGP